MPRNPAAKKGNHNNRHENGLVGPGKRVSRQKSASQLAGNAKSSTANDESQSLSGNPAYAERESASTSASTGSNVDANVEAVAGTDGLRWRKRGSESSADFQDQKWDPVNNSLNAASSKRMDSISQDKSRPGQELSAMQIASTILTSNPAGDTIALLIVLLALPSLVLTIVQALFACLTLMPPSGGASPVSFLSLFDVFQGSHGSPSISTMAVVDIICFGAWMCLWNWAQNFALDLAQIQIAITLGSGTSGKSGSVNTICLMLVLVLHAARSAGLRRFVTFKMLPTTLLEHPRVASMTRFLLAESEFGTSAGSPSKIRSLFALHIISQALMALVRRRISGTSTTQKAAKRLDPEALNNSTTALDSMAQDSLFNTAASPTGMDIVPPPTPTMKESKEKTLSAKKRRRQGKEVRSRQPFWSALASTKVHVLREVEQNKEKAANGTIQDVVSRGEQQDSVYITGVEPSAIHFQAGQIDGIDDTRESKDGANYRPVYVRINNARWHSVTMDMVDEDIYDDDVTTKWTGSIAGLAPDCNYICSFRRAQGDAEIACVMVRTPPLSDRDTPNAAMPPPIRQTARPNSPTTTLKTSIQTAERSREDANNRRNKVRRNHRNALAKLDREIESLQNKLKTGSDDHRQRQKLLQAERNAKQHEEAIALLSHQLAELETIPEDETVEYDEKKASYEARSQLVAEANAALNTVKNEAKRQLSCVNSDLTATVARKDRLVVRNAKLAAETERLTQANIQNMSEKERRAVESAAREKDQQRQSADWRRRINDLDIQLNAVKVQTEKVFEEINDAMISSNGPLTPEGELPGTRNFMFGSINASTFVPDPQASPFQSQVGMGLRSRSHTNQSTGAISGMSGDFDEADPIPPMPSHMDFDSGAVYRERQGSGSSRGQNNHSPGIIGHSGGFRSPHRDSHSPGHFHNTNTW